MQIDVVGAGGERATFFNVKEAGSYLRNQGFGERNQLVANHRNLSDEELLEHAAAWSSAPGSYWRIDLLA